MIEVDDFKAFDAHEVAEMLCLKYRTVTRYIQAGQIRARKIGKKYFVTEQDVKGFILAQETNVETAKTEENDPYLGAIQGRLTIKLFFRCIVGEPSEVFSAAGV